MFEQNLTSVVLTHQDLTLWSFVTSLTIYLIFFRRSTRGQPLANEPPSPPMKSRLPSVAHMIGIFRRGLPYFSDLGVERTEPLSKVSLFGFTIYIVGSARVLPLLHRQPRVISSRSFFAKFIGSINGCTRKSLHAFRANLGADAEGDSILFQGLKTSRQILNSKTGTEMNHQASRRVAARFNHADMRTSNDMVDLFEWVKHEMMRLVSESAYGPENPFWNSDVEEAFWDFEEQSILLCFSSYLPNFLSHLLLKGIRGREVVVEALGKYLRSGDIIKGSPIVNAHFRIWTANIDEADIPRFEAVHALGTFSNTIPTSFWTIYHVFSDPDLLLEIRAQLAKITSKETRSHDDGKVYHIDINRLRTETFLFSIVEEVSRHRTTGTGFRFLTEDTTIGNGEECYYLKKNAWVMISNRALHTEKTEWGENADSFVPDRFMSKTPHMSFRGFGAGASACCGKNLAMYHIASFVALMVFRYDVMPLDGTWEEPEQDSRLSSAQVARPLRRPLVNMVARDETSQVQIEFSY